jgi:hypothetical protein
MVEKVEQEYGCNVVSFFRGEGSRPKAKSS